MKRIAVTFGLLLTTGDFTAAQHAQPSPADVAPTRPFAIKSFGVFRNLMLQGDFGAKVSLEPVMATSPTTGVGAVSEGRGEITIIDGVSVVSYGKEGSRPSSGESAALLAIAKAGSWQTIKVESDVPPSKIESFLADSAKAHGVDPDKAFPFQLTGTIAPYAMHINVAPSGGPYGMGLPMAITVERKGDEIAGRLAGLYVSRDLVGVVTHGGERTHTHWVAVDGSETAHLDVWGIKAGTLLMVPKPE
jgi:hypothetical protein